MLWLNSAVLNCHQMAFTHNLPLLLCIFKDCLIKANRLNKLHLLEINLLLLGSVEFNVLGKKKTLLFFFFLSFFLSFLFFQTLYFNVFFSISAVNVV